MNFSSYYKAWLTFLLALLAFVGSFGSSVPSPAEPILAKEFGVGIETTTLVVSLFVLGYAFGPMLWAPISEVYGRRLSMLPAIFVLGLFSLGSAVCHNATALFVTRFFGGLFGSSAISNVSAAVGDFYTPKSRGVPMAMMAMCVVGGPCLAPLVGAATTVNPHLGWRCRIPPFWLQYLHVRRQLIFRFNRDRIHTSHNNLCHLPRYLLLPSRNLWTGSSQVESQATPQRDR